MTKGWWRWHAVRQTLRDECLDKRRFNGDESRLYEGEDPGNDRWDEFPLLVKTIGVCSRSCACRLQAPVKRRLRDRQEPTPITEISPAITWSLVQYITCMGLVLLSGVLSIIIFTWRMQTRHDKYEPSSTRTLKMAAHDYVIDKTW